MGMLKHFAENVSIEMGFDGELTEEVLTAAQHRLEEFDERYHCAYRFAIENLNGTYTREMDFHHWAITHMDEDRFV